MAVKKLKSQSTVARDDLMKEAELLRECSHANLGKSAFMRSNTPLYAVIVVSAHLLHIV